MNLFASMLAEHLPPEAVSLETVDGFDTGLIARVADIEDETLGYISYEIGMAGDPKVPVVVHFLCWEGPEAEKKYGRLCNDPTS